MNQQMIVQNHNQNRQTYIMEWFNFLGTIVSGFDLILMVLGSELFVISLVNGLNSDIESDINFHFHYGKPLSAAFLLTISSIGVCFASFVLVVASLVGFAGFLKESLVKLSLSWALMIFVVLSLAQSLAILITNYGHLALLINSDAETSFTRLAEHYSEPNKTVNDNKTRRMVDRFRRFTDQTMKVYDCCGWTHVDELATRKRTHLPCVCCGKDEKYLKNCTDNSTEEYVCRLMNITTKGVCKPKVEDAFKSDLAWLAAVMAITLFTTLVAIFLSIRLSNTLLNLFNTNE